MNDLLRSSGKEAIDSPACDVPMNQTWWQMIEKNYTRGEIREMFFGDKGASQRRELQYILSDPAFIGWQQLLMTMDRTRKQDQQAAEQAKAEQAQAEQQGQREDEAHQREQEQHDMAMREAESRHAHGVVNQHDIAKEMGAGSQALFIDGKPVANPINVEDEE
jgi:hypothetical protein